MRPFALAEITPALVNRRRTRVFAVMLLLTGWGAGAMSRILFADGGGMMKVILLLLFVVLFTQVVFGFLLAATGFWVLWRGGDPMRITNTLPPGAAPTPLSATAIVMPIFHEDVQRSASWLSRCNTPAGRTRFIFSS